MAHKLIAVLLGVIVLAVIVAAICLEPAFIF